MQYGRRVGRSLALVALLLAFIGLWLLQVATPCHASDYYVSPNGDDNNPGSSPLQPWKTIQKAANTAEPGDTVHVRAGVYYERVTINVSGSAEAGYIAFRNYGDEVPVVDGTGLTVPDKDNGLFLIMDRSYIIIDGLEIRNYSTSTRDRTPVGIHITGSAHHIQLRNNRIHHIETHAPVGGADAHGIAVFGTATPDSVHDIVIDGNELYSLTLGSSEALVLNGNVKDFTVSNNEIHDVNNIAIDCIGFEGTSPDPAYDQARNGIVSGNRVYNVSSYGNPSYGNEYSAGGIYVDGGKDIVIERNIVSSSDIGIEIASEHKGRATSNVLVRNNVIYQCSMTGISLGGYDKKRGRTEYCTIVNNTLYKNDTLMDGNGEILFQFDTSNNVFKNNILFANAQSLLIGNPYSENVDNVVDYNLYFAPDGQEWSEWEWKKVTYQGFSVYRSSTGNDAHSLFADPKFVDLSPLDSHLSSTSPAIDSGQDISEAGPYDIDGQQRVQGRAIDMGADERQATHSLPQLMLLLGE